jgi:hypothetical protein
MGAEIDFAVMDSVSPRREHVQMSAQSGLLVVGLFFSILIYSCLRGPEAARLVRGAPPVPRQR